MMLVMKSIFGLENLFDILFRNSDPSFYFNWLMRPRIWLFWKIWYIFYLLQDKSRTPIESGKVLLCIMVPYSCIGRTLQWTEWLTMNFTRLIQEENPTWLFLLFWLLWHLCECDKKFMWILISEMKYFSKKLFTKNIGGCCLMNFYMGWGISAFKRVYQLLYIKKNIKAWYERLHLHQCLFLSWP